MLKKPNILVVGSLVMDVTAVTERAPKAGETVIGTKFKSGPGGKGANQAVQCARLGANVTMVGRVGNDAFGQTLKTAVSDAGVDISHVTVDQDESTGVGHITLETGREPAQNRITVCPGANYTLKPEDVAWLRGELGAYDMVIMQFELPIPVVEAVAQWAHEAQVPVMINPAPAAPMSSELLANATYISPNEHEAASLTGHVIRTDGGVNREDVQKVYRIFQAQGVENLIITMGENGSFAASRDEITHTSQVNMPNVVDTTGAGDSFVGAFCTGLTAGLTKKQAMVLASYAAAITVSRMGTMPSLPHIEEVQKLMKERGCTELDPAILDVLR